MKVIESIEQMKKEMRRRRAEGDTIGFVPTMGYLHEGHLSLVREAVSRTDCTVVSVYVNPTQFGPNEDFEQYPRDLDKDAGILDEEGASYLFTPKDSEIYPEGYKTYVEVHDLQDVMCGSSRPGHFRGVCTVVLKLFHIVRPDSAYFGQKDAQQAVILKKMVRDLNMDVAISVLPIVREQDGVALSSRNSLLRKEERKAARCLYKSLGLAREALRRGKRNSSELINLMKDEIAKEKSAKIDYIEIVNKNTLESMMEIKEGDTLIALAVFIGKVRLIDNMIV